MSIAGHGSRPKVEVEQPLNQDHPNTRARIPVSVFLGPADFVYPILVQHVVEVHQVPGTHTLPVKKMKSKSISSNSTYPDYLQQH